MDELHLTRHAVQRMAQRGFHCSDVDVIVAIGTEVRDGYLVTRKDCEDAERTLRRMPTTISRLKGKRLVTHGGTVITAYHASATEERKLLRSH